MQHKTGSSSSSSSATDRGRQCRGIEAWGAEEGIWIKQAGADLQGCTTVMSDPVPVLSQPTKAHGCHALHSYPQDKLVEIKLVEATG
jgi:hypothetical protein